MEEAKQRVKQAGYADTPLEAYITYIRWGDTLNPYMTVDGRIKEAKADNDTFSVRTYFNTGLEDVQLTLFGFGGGHYPKIIVPARCCVAVFTDQSGNVHMGTASIGSEGIVDRTNPLENAETSAVGRALGLAGYGLIPGAGIASAEEMGEASARQQDVDLGSYRIRDSGWGKDRKFGGMTLAEVYENPDGYGAMAWAAGLDDAKGDTKKMAQYFNQREQKQEEAEGIVSVPDGMSLEEYDQRTTMVKIGSGSVRAKSTLNPQWTKYVKGRIEKATGPDKLFGHNNHVINHLKSHYDVAKVMDLTGEKAAALVRYVESNGQDADPRWYDEPEGPLTEEDIAVGKAAIEELFGPESIEDLLKKAAPHLPEAWQDKPEKWWEGLREQFSIGANLNTKQMSGARVMLQAVASGGINWDDKDSDTFKSFMKVVQGIADDA